MPTANELYQQAKVAGNVSFQAEWGRTQQQLAKLSAGERVSQLGFSSLEPGEFVMAFDALGQARMRIGHQSDGTVGVIYGNGTPPPVPTAPSVGARQLGVFIGWDGTFAAGYAKPGDFARVDVHMSEEQGFLPNGETIVGTIAAEGGILVGADSVTHYIKLVAVNSSDVPSAATAEIAVLPLPAGQIAAGAIGAQQLAADIAMLSRLIVGNPDGARLEVDGRIGALVPGMHLYADDGSETFVLNAQTGSVSMKGALRTAEAGQRIVIRETASANDIRFYPALDTNFTSLYASSYVEPSTGATRFGLAMRGPLSDNNRRSWMWVTDNALQMYRGVPAGGQDYGGVFADDIGTSIQFKSSANSNSIPTSRATVNATGASLGFGTGREIGLDSGGVYMNHTNRFAIFRLGDFSWSFTTAIQQGATVPLLWVKPVDAGLMFLTTGVTVYNPATGALKEIGASNVTFGSARATKTSIEDLPYDPIEVILAAPAKMWERRADQHDEKGRKRKARKNFGPMADDLPDGLRVPLVMPGTGEKSLGVDVGGQLATVWAAIPQLVGRVDALKARLAALEGATA